MRVYASVLFWHGYYSCRAWTDFVHVSTFSTYRPFNPSTAPTSKISGLKGAQIHACRQYIWRSCNKIYFQYCSFWYKSFQMLMRRVKKTKTKKRNGFRFGTFIGRFPSDGAAIMAVKGLKADPVKSFLPQHLEPLAPASPGVIRWSSWLPWSCKDEHLSLAKTADHNFGSMVLSVMSSGDIVCS